MHSYLYERYHFYIFERGVKFTHVTDLNCYILPNLNGLYSSSGRAVTFTYQSSRLIINCMK